ncbi:MAG: 2-deoxy-5-keto-D-gluconate 6-phosphate aldolase domain-containing protein [Candidatus Paceibacteria bacterium]
MDISVFQNKQAIPLLALDHRSSLKDILNPEDPDAVSVSELQAVKSDIIHSLAGTYDGILLDSDYGLPVYDAHIAPFLLRIGGTEYQQTENGEERTTVQKYSVASLKGKGAQGIKLLMYFNPYGFNTTTELATAKSIRDECHQEDLPFFLEIVTYGNDAPLSQQITDSLDLFIGYGATPDVWKLEYPGDPQTCGIITQKIAPTPWILLTRGTSYEDFKDNLSVAMDEGCSGFLAGRAIWQEIDEYTKETRKEFLRETARPRFEKIKRLALEKSI